MSVFALVERLAPMIESEVKLLVNSKEEAASLSEKLTKIQEGLKQAELKGVTDEPTKTWLKDLEDVTYEMDEVLDEFESANLQVVAQDTSLSLDWDKVRSLLLSVCLCFKQVVSRREITQKMKALSVRIDTILANKGKYTFVPDVDDHALVVEQDESTSLDKKNIEFYGQQHVKDSLLEKLVSEGEGEGGEDTQIIPIVGVGGVGKSTLARVAYNDPQIQGFFHPKGWVSVSQTFDALVVAKAILESFGVKYDNAHNLETLVQLIKKTVDNNRFLLVLDNVWTEDPNKWKKLRDCLDGGKGSRIVVTTRLQSVARMMGTTQRQSLDPLSDSDCGKILNGIALKGKTGEKRKKLEVIGMEIAKKCGGLPLAASSLGNMLLLRSTEREWGAVLKSPLWEDAEKPSDVFRLLNLSYMDLSPLLKRCLLSSVVFPKGTSLSVDEISRVWMAYGYLNSNDSMQEMGFQHLNHLATRSFFQRVAIDDDEDNMSYKMHNIMHDFATHLSKSDEYSFFMDGGNLPSDYSLGRFRTFCASKEKLSPSIISHLTKVRVLSLRDCNLEGLPKDIGKLIHLRYLNVSDNPITQLPETITDLCNLQTLEIGGCEKLSSLPEGIEKLINLRHLVNTDTYRLVEYPQGLEKLSGLRTLSEFRGSNVGCLRNMSQLQGSVSFTLGDFDEGPHLWEKEHIHTLHLDIGEVMDKDKIVEELKPPPNLQRLSAVDSSGKWVSRWITSFDNLKVVWFCSGEEYSYVPPFGKLPALEVLTLWGCGFERLSVDFLGLENASSSSGQVIGGFPRLKKLVFMKCAKWKTWEDIEEKESVPVPVLMPLLEELEIDCRFLEALPHRLIGKATSLQVVKLLNNSSLYERYNQESGYDRDKMPLLPNQTWTVTEPDFGFPESAMGDCFSRMFSE